METEKIYTEIVAVLSNFRNFAADMPTNDNTIINLKEVQRNGLSVRFHLDDDFFSNLEQDEITGGDVEVELQVRTAAGDAYRFSYTMKGTANVLCDRCLDEVALPVDFSDTVQVAHGDPEDDNGDAVIIPFSQLTYDTSWDIYELIELHFPLQHVHPEGECNADMLSRFSKEEDSENDDF